MTPAPRRPLRCEDGFTLTELLVAMTLSLIVLFAVLGAFDAFSGGVAANNRLTAAEDTARREVAAMVRILRDAGAPAHA
jgi:prepilin-type N-terminal cleavage/methylation domain-containing protein